MDNERLALIEELQGIMRDFQDKVAREVEYAAHIMEMKMMAVKKKQEQMENDLLEDMAREEKKREEQRQALNPREEAV